MFKLNQNRPRGMLYSMTNETDNRIIAFERHPNGTLSLRNNFSTGGNGTGQSKIDPLESQGSVKLSRDGKHLFAVNAGNNSISSFNVQDDGSLTLVGVVPSMGVRPVSLDTFGSMLYVANYGSTLVESNISGFMIAPNGNLTHIPTSIRKLSTPNARPSCVVFSPAGRLLIVSERNTNKLSVYSVNINGLITGPTPNNSKGMGPFGLYFIPRGILLVAESVSNALSSYRASMDRKLGLISGSVPTRQLATCWVSATPSFAYTSNTGSRSITTYRINYNGSLSFLENILSTPEGPNAGAPIDNCTSKDGRYLYALNGNNGSISVFRILGNGRLNRIQVLTSTDLHIGAQGLAIM